MKDLLAPLSQLYKTAAVFKNYLYDHRLVRMTELDAPVISIGNLTVGGTGKTPMTDFCLRQLERPGEKIAVVSRNYRSQIADIGEVDPGRADAAAYFGDEPVLLARRHPRVRFFVGPSKLKTAEYAMSHFKPDLLVVDDGFQHRPLHRDLDIVVFDATEDIEQYQCLPQGRAREPWAALARASVLVITKVNLATAENVSRLKTKLLTLGKPLFEMSYEVLYLQYLQSATTKKLPLMEIPNEKVFLISGIAKPSSFEKSLKSLNIAVHHRFRDHHPYTDMDVQEILAEWEKAGKPRLVTTEKDFVKLQSLWPADVPLWMAPLEVKLLSQQDLFYEILDQVRR